MKNKISSWLFNPFKYIAGAEALILGVIIMGIISFVGYLGNTHFDGVIDIHYGCNESPNPYIPHLIYQIVNWACMTIVFYVTAKITTKTDFRFIDIAGTLALSQVPLLFAAITGFYPDVHLCLGNLDTTHINTVLEMLKENIVALLIASLICILFTIWSIILRYNAYSVSTNIKGVIGGVSFAIALIVSEILSKVILILCSSFF